MVGIDFVGFIDLCMCACCECVGPSAVSQHLIPPNPTHRFENDRTISFIPPDGEFDLMTYRLATHVKPLIWVEAVVEPHSHSRIEYMIKVRTPLVLFFL